MSADQCCTDREIAQLRAQLVVLREQTELSLTRLTRISQEINQERRLRRQVGLDLGDQTQKPVEQNSVPNRRGRSAQSEALESLCAHGLLRKADVSEVHPDLPTLHGLVTRYGTGVSAFRRWLQRTGWVRRAAVASPRPSDTTGGDAA